MSWGSWYKKVNCQWGCVCGCCAGVCILPTYITLDSISGTCTPHCPVSDAQLTISGIDNGDQANISLGITYTGPSYGDPSNVDVTDGFETFSGLTHDSIYTIRIFNYLASCFTDVTATTASIFCPCVQPTFGNPIEIPGTCSGTTPNDDATVTITGITNSDEANISIFTPYTGPPYGDPSNVSSSGGTITFTGLTHSETYTIRMFRGCNTCYIDETVSVLPDCPQPSIQLFKSGSYYLGCAEFVSQNNTGTWFGDSASTGYTANFAGATNLPGSDTDIIDQSVYYFNVGSPPSPVAGESRKRQKGDVVYSFTWSPGVPIKEIAFWIGDVDALSYGYTTATTFTITINGQAPVGLLSVATPPGNTTLLYDEFTGIVTSNAGFDGQEAILVGDAYDDTIVTAMTISSSGITGGGSGDEVWYSMLAGSTCAYATYTFSVINNGEVDLSNIVISDPLITVLGGPISLVSGASDNTTFTGVYALTPADLSAGTVYNIATVSGTTPYAETVTDDDDNTIVIAPEECPDGIPYGAQVTVFKGTCSGDTANNDAFVILSNVSNGLEGNISSGTTYSGATFGDPSNFDISDSSELITGLTHNTDYVIRMYTSSGACYSEISFTTPDITCPDPCLTGETLYYDLEYTFDCNDGGTINIEFINVSGGTPPYEYSVDGGVTWETSPVFINVEANESVFVLVRDSSACVVYTDQQIFLPPEYFGENWISDVGDPTLTGPNDNQFIYNCLGNGNYLIKGVDTDASYFNLTEQYLTLVPFVSGETYCIAITMAGQVNGQDPRIWAHTITGATTAYTASDIIFDTNIPPGTPATGPGTYTFEYTYDPSEDLLIRFGQITGSTGTASFQLVNFDIDVGSCPP